CAADSFKGGGREAESEGEGDCDEGDYRCTPDSEDGSRFDRCEDGAWGRAGHCDGACDAAAGACEQRACESTVSRCTEGGSRQRCGEAVGGWEDPLNCDAGSACDPGRGTDCVPQICIPGQSCADGSTVQLCNEFGTRLVVLEKCSGYDECYEGLCQSACAIATLRHSFVGCLYYGVDLDNRGTGSDFDDDSNDYDVVVANADPERIADVTIERRNCVTGDWSLVSPGTASLSPGESYAFIYPGRPPGVDTHIEGTGLLGCGGYRVTSTQPIVAYQFNSAIEAGGGSWSANASTLYPKSALEGCGGVTMSRYYAVTRPANPNADSLVTVAGMQDGTTVTVTPAAAVYAGPGVAALAPGESGTYTIGEGDVLAFASSTGDMSGTKVEADGPIAVFAHHEGARVISTGDGSLTTEADGIEEQMMPVYTWGENFVASPLVQVNAFTTLPNSWKIMASEDGTEVSFDPQGDCVGLPTAPIALDTGQFAEFLTSNGSWQNPCEFVVAATEPVFVAQFTMWDSYAVGDPAMVTVVPVEQWLDRYAFLAPPFFIDHARVVRHVGASVQLNDVAMTASWTLVGSDGAFESTAITEGANGFQESNVISTTCAGPKEECGVGLSLFGTGGGCAYAYIGGLNLSCINPTVD
ncbi:MAG: IgGFc-binding protein, partial [Myxococcota bacterium]